MSNNSTGSGIGVSKGELWIHLTVFYGFLCGIVTTAGNILIMIGVYRSKKLRNRFFVFVAALTLCRALLCLQFLVMALYRILRTLQLAPSVLTRVACHSVHFWLLVGLTLEMMLLLILVVDRAVAITATVKYRKMTKNQAVVICVGLFVLALLIKLPFSYIEVDLAQRVSCVNSYSAPSDSFNKYTQNIDLILLISVIVLYLLLIVYVQHRIGRLRKNTSSQSNAVHTALKRQLELMPMLRNLVILHCSFALISKVLRTLAGVYDDHPSLSARFTAYGGVFTTIDLFANMVALLWSHKDVRRAARKVCCASGAVSVAEVTAMPSAMELWRTNMMRSAMSSGRIGQ